MVSPLDTRDLLRESTPVAIILLFWVVLSSVVIHSIANGLLRAGVIMTLLYTVVRGVTLARTHQPTSQPDDLGGDSAGERESGVSSRRGFHRTVRISTL